MENAILIVHLVLVLFLIAVVLLQRSEGGALGMGGGGGGVVTGRGAATALQKVTWYLTAGFIVTSLTLTVIAASDRQDRSVIDSTFTGIEQGAEPAQSVLDTLTPPTIGDDATAPAAPAADDVSPPPVE